MYYVETLLASASFITHKTYLYYFSFYQPKLTIYFLKFLQNLLQARELRMLRYRMTRLIKHSDMAQNLFEHVIETMPHIIKSILCVIAFKIYSQ